MHKGSTSNYDDSPSFRKQQSMKPRRTKQLECGSQASPRKNSNLSRQGSRLSRQDIKYNPRRDSQYRPSVISRMSSSVSVFSHFKKQSKDNMDLVYFYSEPLVFEFLNPFSKKTSPESMGEYALQTDLEYRKLVEILRGTEKEFKILKQAINFQSFKEVVSKKPKVIHISCHGDYSYEERQFYLQFETIGNGKADNVQESRLVELLGDTSDHGIQMVVVNACHSEQIGNILYKCKIPFVITVNSDSQIADDICLIFSRHLYMQLLQGMTVEKAFLEAQRTCRASSITCKSCCCAHSHTAQCKWQKFANKHGYDKAHELHSKKCFCKMKNNQHKKHCSVYQEFCTFLREFKDDEKENTNKKEASSNIWAFDDDFDISNVVAYDQKD